jgi:broad specificity phosphatase PhoE
MRRRSPALLALALSLLPAVAPAQKAVFAVRHAEKASEASDPAIPLSDAGRRRGERLAEMLRDCGITAIYSTDTVRTRATAEPLARLLHLTTRIYDTKDSAGHPTAAPLLALLRQEPQAVVLVVGHSNTVPELLSALGAPGKVEIADSEYDNLFLLVPAPGGNPVFLRMRY